MSKNEESKMFVRSTEDAAAVSLIYLHGNIIEKDYKQEIVTNI